MIEDLKKTKQPEEPERKLLKEKTKEVRKRYNKKLANIINTAAKARKV